MKGHHLNFGFGEKYFLLSIDCNNEKDAIRISFSTKNDFFDKATINLSGYWYDFFYKKNKDSLFFVEDDFTFKTKKIEHLVFGLAWISFLL